MQELKDSILYSQNLAWSQVFRAYTINIKGTSEWMNKQETEVHRYVVPYPRAFCRTKTGQKINTKILAPALLKIPP